ncbi:error-prone DNA polymerase [Sphingomonas glaciei]|uniref:Error-prone DNA polymerase n=1 Tax=Sphingomonas glaciei TaxID=2938948 RepID=A0ABY5MRV2_9SPHN|nr:error-prone DNA polymerase [Sphingomonas glaciei]UUR07122.1 error-prone DNA polymerase [Sphingomonas glaciei]
MPEQEGHARRRLELRDGPLPPIPRASFVELGITTPFSFLRGASDALELIPAAMDLGMDAIGVADRNTLAGVVRIHSNAKTAGLKPLIGCRLVVDCTPSRSREGDGGWQAGQGLRLVTTDPPPAPPASGRGDEQVQLLAYPVNREGYARLSRLLSLGQGRAIKGECHLTLADVAGHREGIAFIAWPDDDLDRFEAQLPAIRAALPELRHVAATHLYRGDDLARIERLDRLARSFGGTILASNDVHYHTPAKRPLQDVLTCIREKTTLREAGLRLHANGERHLKGPEEMARLFARWPHALAATRDFADALGFSLDELKYEYPRESVPDDRSPQAHLEVLTWAGAETRYPLGVPDKVAAQLRHELRLIEKLDFARYFLTVHSIVDFARSCEPPILCQGRGSAANSAVCYCLAVTAVDPADTDLLFERFISEERKEPPDIDVDFEHERREEVIQHIYEKYGRDRAGLCATVIHYRPRSAIREVGKVMGLSEDICAAISGTIWGWGEDVTETHVQEAGLDLTDPHLARTVKLAEQLIGMPRHLSQHVGGFILTERPLIETVPIGNGAMPDRTFIEWDKDDIEDLGILKIDVLALGMLTCIRKCFGLIDKVHGRPLDLATVPREESRVYDMLCTGDSLGVFQIESRAQMNMLPRLKPRCFYDLVIEVAIVRPGPIQGDMVHPFLKRRQGKEKVEYPRPSPDHGPPDELERILKRTLGVPVFQEQAMKIALDAAKFSSAEANQLRKAMATFRSRGTIDLLQDKMVERMVARGYDREFAERCFHQIRGFGEYGFPESHAASFAHLVYVSSWLRWRYPAAFACALLNSQPMGFYAPAQIVKDAQVHGVTVLAVDVNESGWDCSLEHQHPLTAPGSGPGSAQDEREVANEQHLVRPERSRRTQDQPSVRAERSRGTRLSTSLGTNGAALRLGLRQVEGLRAMDAARVVAGAPYRTVEELHRRGGVPPHAIVKLAEADCFRSMGLDRRQALWDARALRPVPELPLFAAARTREEGEERDKAVLPAMPLAEHVVSDYQTVRLSLKAHPMQFLRDHYAARGFVRAADLRAIPYGKRVSLAGLVLIRQRPGSAKGVCFITLEDETGTANLVVWPDAFAAQRRIVMGARLMVVHGLVQHDEAVCHLIASRLEDDSARLRDLNDGQTLDPRVGRGDGAGPSRPPMARHPRDAEVIPKARVIDCPT